MGYWYDEAHDLEYNNWDDLDLDVVTTDNPIVDTLLGPDGEPLLQWTERPPFGFR